MAEEIDETWKDMNRTVILFSDKKKVPPLWKAISCHFVNKSVRIGFTDDEKMRKLFNIQILPTILMTDNGTHYVYPGKNSFQDIKKSIVNFFQGKIKIQKSNITVDVEHLKSIEEFNEKCKGKGAYCVIRSNDQESSDFKQIAIKYRNDPFKFFFYDKACSLDYVKDGIYIIHPRREAAIHVPTDNDLRVSLDRVIGGDAHFVPIAKLMEDQKEL